MTSNNNGGSVHLDTTNFREIARSLAALLGVNDPNEANPAEAARVARLWHAQLFPEEESNHDD